ncbi:hypothetical protein AB0368_33625 [Actinoplanes sp. NPDC051475]
MSAVDGDPVDLALGATGQRVDAAQDAEPGRTDGLLEKPQLR